MPFLFTDGFDKYEGLSSLSKGIVEEEKKRLKVIRERIKDLEEQKARALRIAVLGKGKPIGDNYKRKAEQLDWEIKELNFLLKFIHPVSWKTNG